MKKLLTIFSLVFILLISITSYAFITEEEFKEMHRNRLINLCEDNTGENSLFCVMAEFYGLGHIVNYLQTLDRKSEDWKVFDTISRKYFIKRYNTYDFMAIDLEFKAYLQEKEIKNNEGNNLPDRSNLGR